MSSSEYDAVIRKLIRIQDLRDREAAAIQRDVDTETDTFLRKTSRENLNKQPLMWIENPLREQYGRLARRSSSPLRQFHFTQKSKSSKLPVDPVVGSHVPHYSMPTGRWTEFLEDAAEVSAYRRRRIAPPRNAFTPNPRISLRPGANLHRNTWSSKSSREPKTFSLVRSPSALPSLPPPQASSSPDDDGDRSRSESGVRVRAATEKWVGRRAVEEAGVYDDSKKRRDKMFEIIFCLAEKIKASDDAGFMEVYDRIPADFTLQEVEIIKRESRYYAAQNEDREAIRKHGKTQLENAFSSIDLANL